MIQHLTVLVFTITVASTTLQGDWAVFKHRHGKSYTAKEDLYRQSIFQGNLELINSHNERFAKGEISYYLAVNQFADMTNEEFQNRTKCLHMKRSRQQGIKGEMKEQSREIYVRPLPKAVDWRDKGIVTGVKDQGQCESCWAFSTTGSLEGAHAKATGKLVSLSESNLVDCAKENYGCHGGTLQDAFDYIISNGGIDTEKSYPYSPYPQLYRQCKFKPSGIGATMSEYKTVTEGSEAALQEAVAVNGPISVAIDANHQSFYSYAGGVYDNPLCSSTNVDHAVLVVGYGSDNGIDFWLVKNSWGQQWGEQGYVRMSRNKDNQCGIATDAVYPVV